MSEISFNSRANLRQSELNEMHWVSHGMCEHEMHIDLCFKAKQIQCTVKFHCIIWYLKEETLGVTTKYD